MDKALSQGRMAALVLFALALPLVAWSAVANQAFFPSFAFLAHASLCFFIGTEAFGPIASRRSRSSRVLARIFFPLSLLVTAGTGWYLVVWALA